MRKGCLALLFFFALLLPGVAQQRPNVDSMMHLLQMAKDDTTKAKLQILLGTSYLAVAKDTAYHYLQQGLLLSKRSDYFWGIVKANQGLCYWYQVQSNYPRALEYGYKALQMAETGSDSTLLGVSYNVLAHVHKAQKSYPQALAYYKRFYALLSAAGPLGSKALALSNIASVFLLINQTDSALRYADESYQLIRRAEDRTYMPRPLRYLAEAQFQLGNRALGEAYLTMALDSAKQRSDVRVLGQVYQTAATHFFQLHQSDSALLYAKNALPLFERLNDKAALLDLYTLFTNIFQANHQLDSAFFYQSKLIVLNNHIAAQNSVADLQNIAFEERMREQEKEAERRKELEERQHNLQYAAIALGMVALIIGFLVLSHSVLANQKLIRFLGVVSLLIVFEFLNLLLHPWLGAVTHHSPILMLLAMVCIAALLVPLHHKVEHWVIHRLVEKNNRIRLAAAKRTIQQLEGSPEAVILSNGSGTEQKH